MTEITNPRGRFLLYNYDGTAEILPSLTVADKHTWGIRCALGHTFPRNRELIAGYDTCSSCGGAASGRLDILADDVELISSSRHVLSRTWWHASSSQTIDRRRRDVMHWGSREAARDLAHNVYYRRASAGYEHRDYVMYSARVRPFLRVHPDVYLEHHGPGSAHPTSALDKSSVVRYVNSTEAPGSLSVMVRPQSLWRIRRHEVVPRAR